MGERQLSANADFDTLATFPKANFRLTPLPHSHRARVSGDCRSLYLRSKKKRRKKQRVQRNTFPSFFELFLYPGKDVASLADKNSIGRNYAVYSIFFLFAVGSFFLFMTAYIQSVEPAVL